MPLTLNAKPMGELDPKKQNILVIHSWHDILWDRLWCRGLNNILANDYNLIRYDLDAMRKDEKEVKKRAKYSLELAKQYNAVGIVFGDDMALKHAGPLFEGSSYPSVYLGINFSPRKYLDYSKASNFTGVLERPLYKTSFKKILKIFNNKSVNVLLLSDSPLGKEDVTDLAKLFKNSSKIKIFNSTLEFQVQDSWEKWQKAVLDAPANGYDAIFVGSRYILRDKNSKYIEPETEVLSWMNKNSKLPFFGFFEDGIGPKLYIGGWVLSGIEHGESAGNIMKDILLHGKNPADINPIYHDKGQYIFSKKMLEKYKIKLPKEIEEQTEFIEDRHDLWNFDKYIQDELPCEATKVYR